MVDQILKTLVAMTSGVEILAFISIILILSSFLCRGEKNIRLINMLGSVFAIIYSPLPKEPQWSNLILNIILLCVNGFYLLQSKKKPVQN